MNNTIEISITGENVNPKSFSFRKLSDILEKYVDILFTIAKEKNPEIKDKSADFSLYQIKMGSCHLIMNDSLGFGMETCQEDFAFAIENNSFEALPASVSTKTRDLAKILNSKDLALSLFLPTGKTIQFLPETFIDEKAEYYDQTIIYGWLFQLGGIDPNIHLRLTGSDEKLICKVTEDQARSLASRLYTEIGVSGMAKRNIQTMKITDFTVEDILPYDTSDYEETVKDLTEAFSKIKTDMTPEEYFMRLRDNGYGE